MTRKGKRPIKLYVNGGGSFAVDQWAQSPWEPSEKRLGGDPLGSGD